MRRNRDAVPRHEHARYFRVERAHFQSSHRLKAFCCMIKVIELACEGVSAEVVASSITLPTVAVHALGAFFREQ